MPASTKKGKSAATPPTLPQLSVPATVSSRPLISALFLVEFDVKKGYTISWRRTVSGLELSDSVEFKSLPSGLHNVEEDLVYFVHEDRDQGGQRSLYAGISAFVNKTAAKHERGALMLAVGALIKLENGRLGRSWRHADRLKELARVLVADSKKTDLLAAYWTENRAEDGLETDEDGKQESGPRGDISKDSDQHPSSDTRPSLEQAQAKSLMPGPAQELSMFHPARSLPNMLEAFGPLVYPLYKAALLRKRVLLLTEAPVELACNFVYNISIISNIPSALAPLIPLEPLPIRLTPLFSVGVHDIDALSTQGRPSLSSIKNGADAAADLQNPQSSEGWVACTTDDVLRHKKDLYDVVITLPSKAELNGVKQWPQIQFPDNKEICANQRDVRRYRHLRYNLDRQGPPSRSPLAYRDEEDDANSDEEDGPLIRPQSRADTDEEPIPDLPPTHLEPVAWSALAYSSFIWWASAGEKGAELEEEATNDNALFTAFDGSRSYTDALPSGRPSSLRSYNTGLLTDGTPNAPEMAVIAYFHRLTTGIVEVLANLVDDSEEDEEAEARERRNRRSKSGDEIKEPPPVVVDGEDMTRMGLDPWSEADRVFVAQLLELYWGRKADIRGGRIECCGVRIC